MGGRDVTAATLGPCLVSVTQQRAAALHVADRIADRHPDQTATELAANPEALSELRDVLAALGIRTDLISKEPVT